MNDQLHLRWLLRYLGLAITLAGLPLVLWACQAQPLASPNPAPVTQNDQYYDVNPVRDIDILFMVDDSPSMADKQRNLAKNFPVFMEELKKIPGGLPNVHVGVVSSDLGAGPTPLMGGCTVVGGDRGILQTKPSCGLDPSSRFIVSSNAGAMNNFMGDISQVFTCMATLGDRGCGYEHQLQAIRVALYEGVTPPNAGFLRPDAFLGIILLTDEDDCSADPRSDLFTDNAMFDGTSASFRCAQVGHLCNGKSPPIGKFEAPLAQCASNESGRLLKVAEMVDSVRALKKHPEEQIIVSAITGWSDDAGALYRYGVPPGEQNIDYLPICQSQGPQGQATAAIRIRQFVQAFGQNGSMHSICADDFSPAMKQIGETLAAKVGTPCVSAPLRDTKPDPGVQPDCQVTDRVPRGTGYDEQALPKCGQGKTPCWQLQPDAMCTASGFEIAVDRGGAAPVPGTQQAIKCLTCARPDDPACQH